MKSLLVKAGITKGFLMAGGFCVAVAIFIALLEEVALLLAYYFA
jgi:hypothetical protein